MKNILIILSLFLSIIVYSQYDYKEKVMYKFRGNENVTCDTVVYPVTVKNSYEADVIVNYYQKCQKFVWIEEYYTGDVLFWFNGKWRTESGYGKFWKCERLNFTNLIK